MPAAVDLNFPQLLSMAGFRSKVKLSSVKVLAVSGTSPFPCRWQDRDAPADFPVAAGPQSADPEG